MKERQRQYLVKNSTMKKSPATKTKLDVFITIFFLVLTVSYVQFWLSSQIMIPSSQLQQQQEGDVGMLTTYEPESEDDDQARIRNNNNNNSNQRKIKRRTLPSFENGGVVFFYHTPKTGGTTVREYLKKLPNVRHTFCVNSNGCVSKWNTTTRDKVDRFLVDNQRDDDNSTKTKKKKKRSSRNILLLELHGDGKGLLDLTTNDFQRWRDLAQRHNKSFFAFTLVRQPIPFAHSYFHFFHTNCPHQWCEKRQYGYTEQGLKDATIPNRQCTLLSQLRYVKGRRVHPPLTKIECLQTLYKDSMEQELDWIGTTETLSSTTMPLLLHMLTKKMEVNTSTGDSSNIIQAKNQQSTTKSQRLVLKNETLQYVQKISNYDQMIYDNVLRDFTLSQFTNLWDE